MGPNFKLNLFPVFKKDVCKKHGVPLQREALEVLSNMKLTVINGGKGRPRSNS